MSYNQRLSTISIIVDCLNDTRYLMVQDTNRAVDTFNTQLKQAYIQMMREYSAMVDEWVNLLTERGWYPQTQSRSEVVSQTIGFLQNLARMQVSFQGN